MNDKDSAELRELPSVMELMVEIKRYWTTASGEPELKEFAGYVQGIIAAHTAMAEREGYNSALTLLLAWAQQSESMYLPFNWHDAAKALLAYKEMQLPYDHLSTA